MARPVTTRAASEHLSVLARMLRQVDVDRKIKKPKKAKISKLLMQVMREFESEVGA